MFGWLKRLGIGGSARPRDGAPGAVPPAEPTAEVVGHTGTNDDEDASNLDPMEPIAVAITAELDLHGFDPRETRSALEAYLEEAASRGFRTVRIAHGRGRGVQRRITRSVLAEHPNVVSFRDDGANFGATIATLTAPAEGEDGPDERRS